jgi:hypothetical protein
MGSAVFPDEFADTHSFDCRSAILTQPLLDYATSCLHLKHRATLPACSILFSSAELHAGEQFTHLVTRGSSRRKEHRSPRHKYNYWLSEVASLSTGV